MQTTLGCFDSIWLCLPVRCPGLPYTSATRVGVLLRRPAPILMSYLGYPSTSGNLDDRLVADSVVLPPETIVRFPEPSMSEQWHVRSAMAGLWGI